MQVSATVLKDSSLVLGLKQSRFLLISTLILVSGMLCGAIAVKFLDGRSLSFVNDCFKQFLSYRSTAKFYTIFLNSFLYGLIYITLITVSSLGISGFAVTPLLLFVRGFSTCAVAGLLYRNYSLQGIAFANLLLLPATIVVHFIVIYVANEGLLLTAKFYELLKDVSFKGIEIRPSCLKLLKSLIICVAALGVASVIEAVFSAGFMKYFKFN